MRGVGKTVRATSYFAANSAWVSSQDSRYSFHKSKARSSPLSSRFSFLVIATTHDGEG